MSPLFSVFVQDHQQTGLVFEEMLYLQSTVPVAELLFCDFVWSKFDGSINSRIDSFNNESNLSRYEQVRFSSKYLNIIFLRERIFLINEFRVYCRGL